MLRLIFILWILSRLFRRPRFRGCPFMGGWHGRRPPMGGHYPFMDGPHGPGNGFGCGPGSWY